MKNCPKNFPLQNTFFLNFLSSQKICFSAKKIFSYAKHNSSAPFFKSADNCTSINSLRIFRPNQTHEAYWISKKNQNHWTLVLRCLLTKIQISICIFTVRGEIGTLAHLVTALWIFMFAVDNSFLNCCSAVNHTRWHNIYEGLSIERGPEGFS